MLPALPSPPDLTEQHITALRLMASNAGTAVLASALDIAKASVAGVVREVHAVTSTRSRPHAAAWATAHRIVITPSVPTVALTIPAQLTPRWRQVLCSWAGGSTSTELATELGISPATVRGYGQTLCTALGVRTQEQAVVVGVLTGLVTLDRIAPNWPPLPLSALTAPTTA